MLLASIVLAAIVIVLAWTALFLLGIHIGDTLAFVLGVLLGSISFVAVNMIADRRRLK